MSEFSKTEIGSAGFIWSRGGDGNEKLPDFSSRCPFFLKRKGERKHPLE
jgi:hypothetical protein